jgi:hypothetical protein
MGNLAFNKYNKQGIGLEIAKSLNFEVDEDDIVS